MMMESEWVSLGEAAAILGIHPTTVRHWADSGDLPSQRTPGGHRRFRRYDLEQWANLRHNADRDLAPAEVQLERRIKCFPDCLSHLLRHLGTHSPVPLYIIQGNPQ